MDLPKFEALKLDETDFIVDSDAQNICFFPLPIFTRISEMLSPSDFYNLAQTCRYMHWRMFTYGHLMLKHHFIKTHENTHICEVVKIEGKPWTLYKLIIRRPYVYFEYLHLEFSSYYNSPSMFDKVIDYVSKAKKRIKYYCIEISNPKHACTQQTFEDINNLIESINPFHLALYLSWNHKLSVEIPNFKNIYSVALFNKILFQETDFYMNPCARYDVYTARDLCSIVQEFTKNSRLQFHVCQFYGNARKCCVKLEKELNLKFKKPDETVRNRSDFPGFVSHYASIPSEHGDVEILISFEKLVYNNSITIQRKETYIGQWKDFYRNVILEHVSHTVCKSVEIIPLTPHDFHVLDSHSSIVEEELLQQISIVRKGAILPFWLSPSVSAIFRIGSITPETDLPVILHNSSELHIAPVSPSSLSSPSIGPRPLSAVSMEKVDQLLEGVSHQLNLFRNEKPLELISRCLPREISENDKALSDILDNHPSLIFTLYSGNYTICDAVRLTSALDQKKVLFSIVIRIPEAGSNLEGLFLSAQNILKEKPGSSLCSHPWSIDYVKFQTIGLSPKKFQELSSVIVELKDIENDHFPAQKIRSHILSQVSIFPILLSQEGIVYSFHLDGDRFTAHLRPGQKDQSNRADSNETCFAIMTSTKIDFQELDKEPDAVEEGVLKNFGFSNANLFPFSYQADILDDSEKLLNFHFSQPNISTNILILGAAGSGRTSLLTRLGRQLADSWRCVFSLYIDCNTWKGKQAENIEKVLKGEMRKLETRKPSTLFLDNLDFFQLQNEEEQRQIGIEKIFHTIRSFLIQSEVPVIVTAMVFDRHRRRELFLCYLWRTSRRAEKSINYRG